MSYAATPTHTFGEKASLRFGPIALLLHALRPTLSQKRQLSRSAPNPLLNPWRS